MPTPDEIELLQKKLGVTMLNAQRRVVARGIRTPMVVPRRPPTVTPFASQIDPQYPVYATPTTQSVRDNFQFAHDEIEALQTGKVEEVPNTPAGAVWERTFGAWMPSTAAGISDVPTTPPGAVWERSLGSWVQATAPGISDVPTTPAGAKWERQTGAWTQAIDVTGIPEAPLDGSFYSRINATWGRVLPLTGGLLSGSLSLTAGDMTLFQMPTLPAHATPKQYIDDLVTALSGVLILAGTYDVTNDVVAAGGSLGGIPDGPLPPPGATIANRYLILTDAGTGTGNAPPIVMSAGSWLICDGAAWVYIDVAQATVDAGGVTVVPPILGANNVYDVLNALVARITTLEAKVVVLESSIWGIA